MNEENLNHNSTAYFSNKMKSSSNELIDSEKNSLTISQSTLSNSKDIGTKNMSNFNMISFIEKNNSHGLMHIPNSIGIINESDKKISVENIILGKDKRKTVMLRNVPLKYTMKNLLDEINPIFVGKFDYINMPLNLEVRILLFKVKPQLWLLLYKFYRMSKHCTFL